MTTKDISQIALDIIKESGKKPVSKNVFNLKKFLFWFFVSISVIIGAIAFSIIIALLIDNDWNLYGKFGFNFILKTLPYFWFLCLMLFVILGEYYYRKTLLGHRRSFLFIVCIYIILTFILGSLFSILKIGEFVEDSLYNTVPLYRGAMFNKEDIWNQPEKGLLSGQVTFIADEYINIIDNNGFPWIIHIKDNNLDLSNIKQDFKIKIIGNIVDDFEFQASQIKPWNQMRSLYNKKIDIKQK
jgi:hypothetical protein